MKHTHTHTHAYIALEYHMSERLCEFRIPPVHPTRSSYKHIIPESPQFRLNTNHINSKLSHAGRLQQNLSSQVLHNTARHAGESCLVLSLRLFDCGRPPFGFEYTNNPRSETFECGQKL